jgi:hypothetical protein
MANRIGKFQLELYRDGQNEPTVLGTDGISWVDGRWSPIRAHDYVADFAREYCDRYNEHASMKLEWRGTVLLLNGRFRSVRV